MHLGLTGGIACGKTTALQIFSKNGWIIFEADDYCHSLYDRNNTRFIEMLSARWGNVIFGSNGEPDREKIAGIVFNDEKERFWLTSIIHPMVLEEIGRIKRTSSNPMVFSVPLLFEAGWKREFDSTAAVWCEKVIQMRRLLNRGWSRENCQKRLSAQFSPEKKMELADYAIINSGSLEDLRLQCEYLIKNILKVENE